MFGALGKGEYLTEAQFVANLQAGVNPAATGEVRTFGPGEYFYSVTKPKFPVQPGHEWIKTAEVSVFPVQGGTIETPKWKVTPVVMAEVASAPVPWALIIGGAFAAMFLLATPKRR